MRAVSLGAEGVGLLRTEFLYLDRAELPDEDEQVGTLREIAVALEGRPLVIRTLDAGADKPLAALPMAAEANPFLGVRGIRVSLAVPDVLATQLRAILRVAAEFPVKVMLPMVATVDELIQARALLDQSADTDRGRRRVGARDHGRGSGGGVDRRAAGRAGGLLLPRHQRSHAVHDGGRTWATSVWPRCLSGLQPAVLRLVDATVRAAGTRSRWVGVCGELAGDPAAAILLVGLGVTELSMAPALIPEVKATLAAVEFQAAQAAGRAALDAGDPAEVRALVAPLLPGDR